MGAALQQLPSPEPSIREAALRHLTETAGSFAPRCQSSYRYIQRLLDTVQSGNELALPPQRRDTVLSASLPAQQALPSRRFILTYDWEESDAPYAAEVLIVMDHKTEHGGDRRAIRRQTPAGGLEVAVLRKRHDGSWEMPIGGLVMPYHGGGGITAVYGDHQAGLRLQDQYGEEILTTRLLLEYTPSLMVLCQQVLESPTATPGAQAQHS